MSYQERRDTFNKNPVLVARYFQYRVETIFKVIVLDGTLGKAQYYAIQAEFQVRGSPHIHSFIWILNARKFAKVNIDDYRKCVDKVIRSDPPKQNNEPSLFRLVKLMKYIVIQTWVGNTETKSAGSVLLNFSQTKP